jgi:hypothetical protein
VCLEKERKTSVSLMLVGHFFRLARRNKNYQAQHLKRVRATCADHKTRAIVSNRTKTFV